LKFRILAIDGGGCFGAIFARWLARLSASNTSLFPNVDLFAGTSIGGIMSIAYAAGQSPQQVDDLFTNRAGDMFTRELWRIAAADAGTVAKWDNSGRASVMQSILGGLTLGQLKRKVMVETFLSTAVPEWRLQTLHNVPSIPPWQDIFGDSSGMPAWSAGVDTSAAPYYFPFTDDGYGDGGLVNNNPTMTAFSLTQDASLDWGRVINPADISILNVSLQFPRQDLRGMDRGCLRLLPDPLLSMLLTGNTGPASQQAKRIFGDRFHVLTAMLPADLGSLPIDSYDSIASLQQWAHKTDLSATLNWIGANW
jgi:predicted acylesterase/phospholipase RssA